MKDEEAFAHQIKALYNALKAEGFQDAWIGEFITALYTGAASK